MLHNLCIDAWLYSTATIFVLVPAPMHPGAMGQCLWKTERHSRGVGTGPSTQEPLLHQWIAGVVGCKR